VTTVPEAKEPPQLPPQEMLPGDETTVPDPVPDRVTARLYVGPLDVSAKSMFDVVCPPRRATDCALPCTTPHSQGSPGHRASFQTSSK
jgi:hypothetical protein